ncbi:phage protein, HK97 gp10 family [Klebsiella pneumoniae]|nr:phage protein, HK97 gp10 family [Klebsiella pneumoniae]
MADGVEVNLTGLDSVLGKLDAVSQVTRDKSGRAALRKAANVIRDRARNNAARVDDPLTKEAIYKNIVVSFSSKAFRNWMPSHRSLAINPVVQRCVKRQTSSGTERAIMPRGLMILSPKRLSTKTLWSVSAARHFAEPAIQRFVSG